MKFVSSFTPHETIICDDRDPPWINTRMENLINDKKCLMKNNLRSGKYKNVLEKFKLFQNKIVDLTNDSRDRISSKLNNAYVSLSAYWSVFMNVKKTTIVPPSLYESKFVTDYKKKLNYLSHFLLNSAV